MTNPIYRGGLVADPMAAARRQAEAGPTAEVIDLTASQEANAVRLEGETPIAAGSEVHAAVPNLNVARVSKPCVTRGLPADVATNQSPLTAARPRAGR